MRDAVAVEARKARRSRLPVVTAVAFAVVAAVGALFMFILADPQRARELGLLGAKAQLAGGTADWPGYFALLAQISAVAGVMIFGVVQIWIFGREFADHTAKDLLALPTPRGTIVAAKFVVSAVWSLVLALELYTLGLVFGALLGLPRWSAGTAWLALGRLLVTAGMTWLLVCVLGFAASAGRGYLAAVGVMFVIVFCAQIVAALGYGHLFPWSVPGIYSGLAGADKPSVGFVGFALVGVVGCAGIGATLWWWRAADQAR
ncbi:ABC transporter permease [Hamadaea sp. NPDC050747]|uniref:ABC transporter permease n=1 Tax=Hamadaea sp. NPDC050747 TaxID=3155789 RepID=UPI0033CF6111